MIEHLFIRSPTSDTRIEQLAVQVVAGAGIHGDRYFGAQDEPGQNVSFIEAEELEAFAERAGCPAPLSSSGRNVVTRGVRLNALVGKTFTVGARFASEDRSVTPGVPGTATGQPPVFGHGLTAAQPVRLRSVGSPTPAASKPPSAASTWPLT